MIRRLSNADNDQVMNYLLEEKALNLFIIGDIENFGYDCDFVDVWADFDEDNNIKGILLRYFHSYVVYEKGDFNVDEFAKIINKDMEFEILSGKKDIIEKFYENIEFGKKKEMYFAEMINDKLLDKDIDIKDIKKATVDDVDYLCELRESIEEFNLTPANRKSFRNTLESKTGRTYFVEKDGRVTACASTSAENSASAMVVGVCTHPEYRRQGLASKCVTALCQDLLDEGRTLCLFYNNPSAGKIYKRLGFKDIGKWVMCLEKK